MSEKSKKDLNNEADSIFTELYNDELKNANSGLNAIDRVRLIADGALMGWSDEISAYIQSFYKGKTYDEIVRDERILLDRAMAKDGSFKYQLGGAFLPSVLAAPFTGGGSVPLSFGRLAVIGGGQGLVTAIGNQGEVIDPTEVAVETGMSMALTPALAKTINLAGTGFKKIVEKSGGLSKRVEDKLMEIVEASGESKQSIIDAVLAGKTIPEISDQMALNIRTVYAKSPQAGKIISDSVEKRFTDKPKIVTKKIQKGLSKDAPEGNVLQQFTMSEKALTQAESKAYNEIFEKFKNLNNPEVDNLVLNIVNRINPKQLTKDINLINTMKGLPSVFKKNKDGLFELNRSLSLEEAENAYRVIRDLGEGLAKKDGKFTVASGVKDLANELKNKLDDISPELKATRANYRTIKESRVQFDEGSKLLGNSPDKVEVILNQKFSQLQNQPELLQAFKEGVANNIRAKIAQKGGKPALVRRIANPDSQEYKILQKLFTDNEFTNLMKDVNIAMGAMTSKNVIKGGSITATALGRQDAVKPTLSKTDALELGLQASSMNPFAIMRLVKFFFPNKVANLSDDEMQKLAQLIINEDAELLQNAVTNMEARNKLLEIVDRKIGNLQKSIVRPAGEISTQLIGTGGRPQDVRSNQNNEEIVAKEFLENMPINARKKILETMQFAGD